ncbi:CxxxxCH/CxxCH domain-containing protein [Myxococcota bacterium]|nr:CxxxxCH/CxxCH domain-containing protein [Myxococcota bacterium]
MSLALGCAEERRLAGEELCPSWLADVRPLFARDCTPCHAGRAPAAAYALDDYVALFGGGRDDTPNARGGDDSSRLLTVLTAEDPLHAPFTSARPLLTDWVVRCDLAYSPSNLHARGVMNPLSDDFHGRDLRAGGWDFARCARCHGADFEGGAAARACTTCHVAGPTACVTCHGDGPTSGAHPVHLVAPRTNESIGCASCHVVPDRWDAPGHLFDADGALDEGPAEVRFADSATIATTSTNFDMETGTCSGVVCHGARLPDAGGDEPLPRWTSTATIARCSSCHGHPPPDHPSARCLHCHPGAPPGARPSAIDPARHIDGVVELGRRDGRCEACHGMGTLGGPPPDLDGETDPARVTVGLHTAHAIVPSGLRGPIPCSDCHVVPERLIDEGHIDTDWPAEVFPEDPRFAGLAEARGAAPSWDHTIARCSDVYCHGGGALTEDASPSIDRRPSWTATPTTMITCGACHGVPPLDLDHDPRWTITDCARCHASAIDATGRFTTDTDPAGSVTTRHVNGIVDL